MRRQLNVLAALLQAIAVRWLAASVRPSGVFLGPRFSPKVLGGASPCQALGCLARSTLSALVRLQFNAFPRAQNCKH
ncbi:hypothetical protein NDU88_002291 [Pleurodeles waltl]|uniref:Secreted protein n=1 Tax=Pleurodeles waltl TaxID=8319 RepID=A0AAV7WQ84_PLEWA|nr:hypothetical protein NDU88_002291 [Pleurodeles waltl]